MTFAWVLSALASAFGASLGMRALIDPDWAARLVRLRADERGGGFAEFRATYGGLIAFAHGVSLALTLMYLDDGDYAVGVAATGAAAVLGAGWAGACLGRLLAMWRDKADTPFNRLATGVQGLVALAIAAPWVVWVLS
jgi:hypothetical protein